MASIPQVLFTPAQKDRGITGNISCDPSTITPEEQVTFTFGSFTSTEALQSQSPGLLTHQSQQPQLLACTGRYFAAELSNLNQLFLEQHALQEALFPLNKEFLS